MKFSIIQGITIMAAGLVFLAFVLVDKQARLTPVPDVPPHLGVQEPDNDESIDTSDWVEYRNDEYDYAFSYPPDWTVAGVRDFGSNHFLAVEHKDELKVFDPIAYGLGDAFSSPKLLFNINARSDLPVGACSPFGSVLSDNQGNFAGTSAQVVEYTVQGGDFAGALQPGRGRCYYFQHGDLYYIVHISTADNQGGEALFEKNEALFEAILATFEFIDQ